MPENDLEGREIEPLRAITIDAGGTIIPWHQVIDIEGTMNGLKVTYNWYEGEEAVVKSYVSSEVDNIGLVKKWLRGDRGTSPCFPF